MRHLNRWRQAAIAMTLLLGGADAHASPFDFAQRTPGYPLVDKGSQFYSNGFYSGAIRHFERAAHWADKMAQHNLGVMHYRGDGVERDPARAWAWFELAAEREYPEFVGIADAVWAQLDEAQRERAQAIFEELRPDYGDETAVPRTRRRMERERRNVTGSRTGSVGNVTVIDGTGTHDGEHYFAEEKWDFERIIELETRAFEALARGNVTIGELELLDEEKPGSDKAAGDSRDDADPPEDEPAP